MATALGVVLGLYPYFTWAGLIAFGIWIAVTLLSRYVSLGSIVAAAAFVPLLVAFNWPVTELWPLVAFAAAGGERDPVGAPADACRQIRGIDIAETQFTGPVSAPGPEAAVRSKRQRIIITRGDRHPVGVRAHLEGHARVRIVPQP